MIVHALRLFTVTIYYIYIPSFFSIKNFDRENKADENCLNSPGLIAPCHFFSSMMDVLHFQYFTLSILSSFFIHVFRQTHIKFFIPSNQY
jgi:hypothetical protein